MIRSFVATPQYQGISHTWLTPFFLMMSGTGFMLKDVVVTISILITPEPQFGRTT